MGTHSNGDNGDNGDIRQSFTRRVIKYIDMYYENIEAAAEPSVGHRATFSVYHREWNAVLVSGKSYVYIYVHTITRYHKQLCPHIGGDVRLGVCGSGKAQKSALSLTRH